MVCQLTLTLQDDPAATATQVRIERAVIAGWTGRDRAAVEHHIAELELLGVKRPASVPVFYRVSAARLTTDPVIEATGNDSSGEVEFVLLKHGGKRWVGVGSDHTDRVVETYGVTVSKQMCDKPIAPVFWAFDSVAAHWDQLMLRSWIEEAGTLVPYQEGAVAAMLEPRALLGMFAPDGLLPEGTAMFGGTLAARGGIRPAPRFVFELSDPVLGRAIRHEYRIATLPVMG